MIKIIRVLGLWRFLIGAIIFPFWFVYDRIYFRPKLRKKVISDMCGGDASQYEEEMLGQYAQRFLPPIN